MRRAAGLLLVAAALPAAAAPAERAYVIERVGDRIAPDTVVGPKRAGIACFPNGQVRWSEVGFGGVVDRRDLVQDVLEDAGLPVASFGSALPSRRQIRLRGAVTEASVDLCARNMLGRPGAMSGTARLIVEWRGESDGDTGPLRHVSTIERRFDRGQAASLGAIGRALLTDAARDLATWLQAPGDGAAADPAKPRSP